MKRLIYLEDAIDALEREKTYSTAYKDGYAQTDYFKQYNMGLTDGIKALNKLPSAQPEQRWIPVTEALPKEEDCPMDCLVTRKSKFIGNYTDMAVCEKNGTWTHEDWDAIVLGDVEDGKSTGLISTRDDNIIAWMPLPEPYKGE